MSTDRTCFLLLGVLAGLFVAFVVSSGSARSGDLVAHGGTVDRGGDFVLATGQLKGGAGQAEALYVWYAPEQKLAVYVVSANGPLELHSVRNCVYDFAVTGEFSKKGAQTPSVKTMLERTSKSRKSAEEGHSPK
jgi:hypothetical protein